MRMLIVTLSAALMLLSRPYLLCQNLTKHRDSS